MTSNEGGVPSLERRTNELHRQVGRVVVDAALMELWLFHLACTLDRTATQEMHAGKSASELITLCRTHLDGLPPQVVDDIQQVLDDLVPLLERRNTVVHSVHAQPGELSAYAHRPVRESKRQSKEQWIANAWLTVDVLAQLDVDLIAVFERLYRLRQRAERPSPLG